MQLVVSLHPRALNSARSTPAGAFQAPCPGSMKTAVEYVLALHPPPTIGQCRLCMTPLSKRYRSEILLISTFSESACPLDPS